MHWQNFLIGLRAALIATVVFFIVGLPLGLLSLLSSVWYFPDEDDDPTDE